MKNMILLLLSILMIAQMSFAMGSGSGHMPCDPKPHHYSVPEPATLALVAFGLIGIVVFTIRKKK